MSTYRGRLEMTEVTDRPIDIYIDLNHQFLAIRTSDDHELGEWPIGAVRITGRDDGFTFSINGVPAWVRTENDGAFANEIGLRWAPPRLRRLMATQGRSVPQPV